MSFTLEVTIAGLCVLVPDPNTNEMHVLMPNTHGVAESCSTQHEARIYYDPKYLSVGNSAPDVPPKDWKWDNIFGGSLSLSGLGPVPAVVLENVLAVGAKVHSDCLTRSGGQRLDARVTLGNPRSRKPVPDSVWSVPGGPELQLAFQATFSMLVDAPSLTWNVASLGADTPSVTELHPVNTPAGDILKVMIAHGESAELPENSPVRCPPPVGSPPKHIGTCLMPIFPPGTTVPDVRYIRELLPAALHRRSEYREELLMPTTFSCMLTSGDMP